jgi:hypothetical protein
MDTDTIAVLTWIAAASAVFIAAFAAAALISYHFLKER